MSLFERHIASEVLHMSWETTVGLIFFVIGAVGLLLININPQWTGFNKLKNMFKKGCK